MATRHVTRSLATFTRTYTTRLRPLTTITDNLRNVSHTTSFNVCGFATRQTSSSLRDPNPNWSNRPPKETILLDGCDFEHWLVVMENPEGDPTRDEIIHSYIKTLATIVGSEEEARMKIYSVSTRHYFAFGALVSEELSYKLKELPKVRWVLPDSYLDVRNKDYGGEPFINGQAVPYDPKYHKEWLRNSTRAKERTRRTDRSRDFDRSRSFERRREMRNQPNQNPGSNMPAGGPPPNMGGMQQPSMGGPSNMGGIHQQQGMGGPPNMGGMHQQQGMGGPPNAGGMHQRGMVGSPNMGGMHQPGVGGPPPHAGGMQQQGMGGPPRAGGMQQQNMPPNMGGVPPDMGGVPPHNYGAPNSAPSFQYIGGPNNGGTPYQTGPGPNQSYDDGNSYQNQNISGRDMPPRNYQ